jgi:transposase-like protein
MSQKNPYKYFNSSPEVIKLSVMYYVRYPLSFRQVEDILSERGIDICHETVRFWVNRFGPKLAREIRKKRRNNYSNWRWNLDEMYVKVNGEHFLLWRAVDHEGEVLEAFVSKRHCKRTALKFMRKLMKRYGRPGEIVTDKLRSYGAAFLWCSVKSLRRRKPPKYDAISQQQMRKFALTITKAGESDAEVPKSGNAAEICNRSWINIQSLQSRKTSGN